MSAAAEQWSRTVPTSLTGNRSAVRHERVFVADLATPPGVAILVGQDDRMLIVHATKKLLDRVGGPSLREGERSSTILVEWYATALRWRPQVALLVNEATLLPVLMPLAPAATMPTRIGAHIGAVLAAHQVSAAVIAAELDHMRDYRLTTTANRSVIGIMNEFTHLADAYRVDRPNPDLTDLALRLATTPCSPLYRRHVSPDRELVAYLHTRHHP